MKRTSSAKKVRVPDIHPEALSLLALIVGAVALTGIFAVWMQVAAMHEVIAMLKSNAQHTAQQADSIGKQLKRLVSVPPQNQPISYAVDNLAVTVLKDVTPADFKATDLEKISNACGVRRPEGYFARVADGLRGATQAIYTFRYDTAASYTGGRAIIVQNKLKYKNVAAVRADFASCGGAPLPVAVNKDWVLFLMPCLPSGNLQDSEVQQAACQEIAQALATVHLR